MTCHLEGLNEKAALALSGDRETRLAYVRSDFWVGYPDATAILRQMQIITEMDRVSRMPCLLVAGRPNNGKTSLLKRYLERNPARETKEAHITPAVFTIMPERPTARGLWSSILTQMFIPHRKVGDPAELRAQVERVFAGAYTRVLVIDEFHHILNLSVGEQEITLAGLKNLSSTLNIALFCAGTSKVIGSLRADTQLGTRFNALGLQRWESDERTLSFLKSIEQYLPFAEPSNLAEVELAEAIYQRSDKTLGGIVQSVKAAAVEALSDDADSITIQHLKRAPRSTAADQAALMSSL